MLCKLAYKNLILSQLLKITSSFETKFYQLLIINIMVGALKETGRLDSFYPVSVFSLPCIIWIDKICTVFHYVIDKQLMLRSKLF